MYGDQARIGLILPSLNTTAEPESTVMAPDGVSVHFARVRYQHGREGPSNALSMAADAEEAARLLATCGVNVIAYACTTGSIALGVEGDARLTERISTVAGIPATTTATAVIRAFRALRTTVAALGSPYGDDANRMEARFFLEHGIEVVKMKGLSVMGADLRRLAPAATEALARDVDDPRAEAIFLSCTNLRAITVIGGLESELGKPVFSSNTATMWDALRIAGQPTAALGRYGSLFAAGA